MKRYIIVILFCLFLTLILCSCNQTARANEGKRYYLRPVGDSYRLVIDDEVLNSIESTIDVKLIKQASIAFDSIDDFVDTLKNGKLSNEQLAVAYKTFKRDDNGIKVCDINSIKIPVSPNEMNCKTVYWNGELYSFYLEKENNAIAYYHVLDKSTYDNQYENNYTRFFENENVTITKILELPDSTEYYYSTAKSDMKKIRYALSNNNTNLIIDETYRLSMVDGTIETSNDIPYKINIYGEKAGDYFSISIFDFVGKPSPEWLTQFGIKNY